MTRILATEAGGGRAQMAVVYGMVTTTKSSHYTLPALQSFFQNTRLNDGDRFVLIDNNADYTLPAGFERVEMIRNPQPKSFAQNVNAIVRLAEPLGADVIFPNNDIIFGPGWLEPLLERDDAILIPLCNQFRLYSHGTFALEPMMDLEQYLGHEAEFTAMVQGHQRDFGPKKYIDALHISFFCFRIPRSIYAAIGLMDENFVTGGEDIDYRIRAHLAGFQVCMAAKSYLLHFMGKSTWRGAESSDEFRARTIAYYTQFVHKWGVDIAQVFLMVTNWREAVARTGVEAEINAGNYEGVIRRLLARRTE